MEMKCRKCGATFGQQIGVTLCLPNGYNVTALFKAVAPCGHWVKWHPDEVKELPPPSANSITVFNNQLTRK